MIFQIGTGHGISTNSYAANANPEDPGEGSGQVTRSAPPIFGATSDVTIAAYKTNDTGTTFHYPLGAHPSGTNYLSQFIDDSTITSNTSAGLEKQNNLADI